MSYRDVNLAARPFANERPVKRVSIMLWVIGGILMTINAVLYWQAIFGLEDTKDELVDVDRQIAEEQRLIAEAESTLRGMDLGQQNAEATYLNEKIDERTFPWSRLFDELARVMPRGTRLHSLRPVEADQTRERAVSRGRRVHLAANGTADSFDSLLELLDALFADSAFENPVLPKYSLQKDSNLRFQLYVDYYPDLPLIATVGLAESTPRAVELPAAGQPVADSTDSAGQPPTAMSLDKPPPVAVELTPDSVDGGESSVATAGSAEVARSVADQPPTVMQSEESPPVAVELTPVVTEGSQSPQDDGDDPGRASPLPTAVGRGESGTVGSGAVGSGAVGSSPAAGPLPQPMGLRRTASGPGGRR